MILEACRASRTVLTPQTDSAAGGADRKRPGESLSVFPTMVRYECLGVRVVEVR